MSRAIHGPPQQQFETLKSAACPGKDGEKTSRILFMRHFCPEQRHRLAGCWPADNGRAGGCSPPQETELCFLKKYVDNSARLASSEEAPS